MSDDDLVNVCTGQRFRADFIKASVIDFLTLRAVCPLDTIKLENNSFLQLHTSSAFPTELSRKGLRSKGPVISKLSPYFNKLQALQKEFKPQLMQAQQSTPIEANKRAL